ncbi:MAG: hypothetical protein WKG01_07425 [Kofleriaceae bacterium]
MSAPQPDDARRQAEQARKLVNLSHLLGYGGLGAMLVLGPLLGYALHSIMVGLVIVGFGGVSAVGGAIVGQIGRGMQGRVI